VSENGRFTPHGENDETLSEKDWSNLILFPDIIPNALFLTSSKVSHAAK
jgi:hypothetical protein